MMLHRRQLDDAVIDPDDGMGGVNGPGGRRRLFTPNEDHDSNGNGAGKSAHLATMNGTSALAIQPPSPSASSP
jgi:hypothetical protein